MGFRLMWGKGFCSEVGGVGFVALGEGGGGMIPAGSGKWGVDRWTE